MGNKNAKNSGGIGLKESLKILIFVNKRAVIAMIIAVPLLFISIQVFEIKIPYGLLIALLILALTILVYLSLLSRKVHKTKEVENICLAYLLSNVILYTFIIHYMGGVEGIGIILYSFLVIEASIILPIKKSISVILVAIISFGTLGFLEYYKVIPHYEFFLTGPEAYDNFSYLLFVVVFGAIFAFNYSGLIARRFSNVYRAVNDALNKERIELVKAQSQLKESKDTLEVRVVARTKELEEFSRNLEGEVEQRTKELQEKIKELEKFQRFTVDRELKMTELKEQIRGKKEKLE